MRYFLTFLLFLIIKSFSFAGPFVSLTCREILKQPSERNEGLLKNEIFALGDNLLEEFFNHHDFALLDKPKKELFVFQNKEKIIQNITLQSTSIERLGASSAYVVRGGASRLGRMAVGLRKFGVSVLVDIDLILKKDAAAFYSPKRRMIILGLEDALYPNQLSYNFLHEAMHASIDHRALFIPRIYDEFEGSFYEDFSLDELLVYAKQLLHMNNESVQSQNSEAVGRGRDLRFLEAIRIFKNLSERTLNKKNELIKVVDHLKKVEANPLILNSRNYRFLVEELDPQIFLMRSGFVDFLPSQVTEELFDLDPSLRFKIFQGDKAAYVEILKKKARFSRLLIEEALFLAENAFRQNTR